MAKPLNRQAPPTTKRALGVDEYHAKLWVDSHFGELTNAVKNVAAALAKRNVGKFGAEMASAETRKILIARITMTAVGMIARRFPIVSPHDNLREMHQRAALAFRTRMGSIAAIGGLIATAIGWVSSESEGEAIAEAIYELDHADAPPPGMRAVEGAQDTTGYSYQATDRDLPAPKRPAGGMPSARAQQSFKPAALGSPRAIIRGPVKRSKGSGETDFADMPVTVREPVAGATVDRFNRREQAPWDQVMTGLQRARRAQAKRDPTPPTLRSRTAPTKEGEFESGWDLAIKQSQPRSAIDPGQAREARRRIRAAAAPALAAALDRAVDARLLTQFAARHPGGIDAAKLRQAYVESAVRRFAGEFVKLIGGAPPASAEDIALGAIIAVAIAETSARFPIIAPAAVAPMAVLVHRALRPQLQTLARMAAVVAKTPAPTAATGQAPARSNGASREMVW